MLPTRSPDSVASNGSDTVEVNFDNVAGGAAATRIQLPRGTPPIDGDEDVTSPLAQSFSGDSSNAKRFCQRHRTAVLVGVGVSMLAFVVIAVVIANLNHHFATGGLPNPPRPRTIVLSFGMLGLVLRFRLLSRCVRVGGVGGWLLCAFQLAGCVVAVARVHRRLSVGLRPAKTISHYRDTAAHWCYCRSAAANLSER